MKKRVDSLTRIGKLAAQMHDLGRWRLTAKRLDTLARESERVTRVARAYGMRAKLAERAAETAGKAWLDKEARKELAEVAERALMRRRDASQR